MKTKTIHRKTGETGYTLITTMVISVAAAVLMAGTLSRVYSGAKLNDRNNAYIVGTAAAEAATEKTMAQMMIDFAVGGEASLSNNLSYYQTKLLPTTGENSFWTNFVFSDGQGHANQIYVARTTTNANPPYVLLESQYPGLYAFAATYRIQANASLSTTASAFEYYNFTNSVCQDVQMAEIPVFQFAIFYNGLLEFTDCAPLVVNGRVQCNSNIYVGCPSSTSTLLFNYTVNASGVITNPSWFGYSNTSYINSNVTYAGTPVPGYAPGQPVLTLPMGAATNNPIAIIQLPTSSDSSSNQLSLQRYYYKADLVILVTNVTSSNVATTLILKNSMFDSGISYSITNNTPTNSVTWTNWLQAGFSNWLSTNSSFYDLRQKSSNLVTQIDVGKFGTWIATNTNCVAKWNSTTPFNGIIYVADLRTTNAQFMDCVRLTNGQTIPTAGATNIGGSSSSSYSIPGLTVATINPLYVQGLYNCPGTNNVSNTNTSGTAPCSVVCDALTILSTNWQDSNSWAEVSGTSNKIPAAAANDTVNAAIIAGNVPSTGSAAAQFSGGVHNLPRLLENWGSSILWLNTSIINLYPSQQATAQFEAPGNYYDAPTRKFYFNTNYSVSTGLPPGTPQIDRMIRADWFTPPPNTTNVQFSPTLSFVPQ